MIYLKLRIFIAIFLLIPFIISCENVDLLQQCATKPQYLELIKYEIGNDQTVCSALYRVPGKYAHMVEKYFINKCDMGELVFICCGWEPKDGRSGKFNDDEYLADKNIYRYYRITMYSDETLIQDREQWSDIQYFYVQAEILEI